ncbi:hypothetical protein D3C79_1040450 [compost metagenome]
MTADNLNMHMVLTCEKETLPYWEVSKTLFLFLGQLEYIREYIDGTRRLLQEKLH